jgi:LPS sulfotransferase NodH
MQSKLYLVIGAQKAGTTWLYEKLRNLDSTSIFTPIIKELNFFNQYYDLDKNALGNRLKQLKEWSDFHIKFSKYEDIKDIHELYEQNEVDINWYKKIFHYDNSINVDISPEYSILSEDAIYKISKDIKVDGIILIMRKPSERAISHIRMDVTVRGTKFDELIDSEDVYSRSDYMEIIRKWEPFFKGKIFLFDYDVLKRDPTTFINSIFNVLGVDINVPTVELSERVHDSKIYNSLTDDQINQVIMKYQFLDSNYDLLSKGLI